MPGITSLAVNADGQIFFAAAGQVLGGGVNLRVAEFNKYGTVDSSFGTSGTASTGTISGDGIGVVLEIELNGQIVIGAGGSGSSGHFILGRFNANGSKDTTFGSGGVEIGAAEGGGLAMVTAANGEAVLIGKRSSGNGIILQEFGTLADSQILYPTFDADNNITSITDQYGNVLERYEYDGYGNVTVLNANGTVRGDGTIASSFYGWMYFGQGKRYSVSTGTVDYNARVYILGLGRFAQLDPAGDINGLEEYQYELSNPTDLLDSSGMAAEWHHLLPRAIFKDIFGGAIDDPEFGLIMDDKDHNLLHSADWNGAWQLWKDTMLAKGKEITLDAARKQLAKMMKTARFKNLLKGGIKAPVKWCKNWRGKNFTPAQLEALDNAVKRLPSLSEEQLAKLNNLLEKAATLGAAGLPLALGLIQGLSVGNDIRNDKYFQAFVNNAIDVLENPNSASGDIYGNNYNNAKNSVGLEMATLDGAQYLNGGEIIDILAKTFVNLKSQLAQAQ